MQEIRINQNEKPASPVQPDPKHKEMPRTKVRGGLGVFLKLLIAILAVALICFGGYVYISKANNKSLPFDPAASPYYAVFLSNGQVYFGRPLEKNRSEFTITDVYYLQLSDDGVTPAEPASPELKFNIIKLGNELHGPTDMLIININSILFYEQLKSDSDVVKSITSAKSE